MNKGVTLKSFLIVSIVIILMIAIAFMVQRVGKEPDLELESKNNNEIIEEEIQEEIKEEIQEEIIQEEENNNQEKKETSETNEFTISVDCGDGTNLTDRARQDLSLRLNVDKKDIIVSSCEKNIFSDHTLGTSSPGEIYYQNPTVGYVLILIFNDREYKYHGNENVLFFIN